MSNTWPGGFREEHTDYYAAVGYLCHQWNTVEHFVYSLATETLHLPNQVRTLLFRHMGITSAMVFIEDYAAAHHDPDTQAQLKHTAKFVDCCRINRNLIVHGFPDSDPETGTDLIRSVPDKNRKVGRAVPISIEAVRRVCTECEQAGNLLIRAQFLVAPKIIQDHFRQGSLWPAIQSNLYAKPPLPKLLAATPHESPKPQPQDGSS